MTCIPTIMNCYVPGSLTMENAEDGRLKLEDRS